MSISLVSGRVGLEQRHRKTKLVVTIGRGQKEKNCRKMVQHLLHLQKKSYPGFPWIPWSKMDLPNSVVWSETRSKGLLKIEWKGQKMCKALGRENIFFEANLHHSRSLFVPYLLAFRRRQPSFQRPLQFHAERPQLQFQYLHLNKRTQFYPHEESCLSTKDFFFWWVSEPRP